MALEVEHVHHTPRHSVNSTEPAHNTGALEYFPAWRDLPKHRMWLIIGLSLSQFSYNFNYGIPLPFMTHYYLLKGYTPAATSIATVSFWCGSFLSYFAIPFLPLNTKQRLRRSLVPTLFIQTVTTLLSAIVPLYEVVVFARVLQGFSSGFVFYFSITVGSHTTTNLSHRGLLISIILAADPLGETLGPWIGGMMFNYGVSAPFWVASGVSLFTMLWLVVMEWSLVGEDVVELAVMDSRVSLSDIFTNTTLTSIFCVMFLCSLNRCNFDVLLPLDLHNRFSSSLLGVLLGAEFGSKSLGMVLFGVLSDHFIVRHLSLFSFVALPLTMLFVALTVQRSVVLVFVFVVLFGLFSGSVSAAVVRLVADSDEDYKSKVANTDTVLVFIVLAVFWDGGLVVGSLVGTLRNNRLLYFLCGLGLISALYFAVVTRPPHDTSVSPHSERATLLSQRDLLCDSVGCPARTPRMYSPEAVGRSARSLPAPSPEFLQHSI